MQKMLGAHAIGIPGLPIPDAIDLARETGFDAITFDLREAARLVDARGLDPVRELFANAGVRPGSWNVPANLRQPDQFEDDLKQLPRLAALAIDLGCPRATTGAMPGSNERTFDENFAWHVERLRRVAEPLRSAGCRIGIEFIGPKTLRAQFRHEFVYTLGGVMDIARAAGTGNIGVLLDIWHLYTSGGALADLDGLTAEDIVVVHVNDAPAGIPRDEQVDSARALPLATGVLEIVPFMKKLQTMGFDGPVMPEPFSDELNALAKTDPKAAARTAGESMAKLWAAAGLA